MCPSMSDTDSMRAEQCVVAWICRTTYNISQNDNWALASMCLSYMCHKCFHTYFTMFWSFDLHLVSFVKVNHLKWLSTSVVLSYSSGFQIEFHVSKTLGFAIKFSLLLSADDFLKLWKMLSSHVNDRQLSVNEIKQPKSPLWPFTLEQ